MKPDLSDLEITRACAAAMGESVRVESGTVYFDSARARTWAKYDPLTDDAQCLALVRRFNLSIQCRSDLNGWYAVAQEGELSIHGELSYAICLCVARLPAGASK